MAANVQSEYLGLEGAPPERTTYLSMFHASGVHRPSKAGTWQFSAPRKDTHNWGPSWKRLQTLLEQRVVSTFEDLTGELERPPYGLRPGPSLLLMPAFMVQHRH